MSESINGEGHRTVRAVRDLERLQPLAALLELGENVITIAHLLRGGLWGVSPDLPVADAKSALEQRGFDVAPVEEEPLCRFVDRADLGGSSGTVGEVARVVEAADLVSASLSVAELLDVLAERPWVLVLSGHTVDGIITRADLQLPAVSLVVFGWIVGTEALLDRLVAGHFEGDAWLEKLSTERRRGIEEVFAERRQHNAEITRAECSNLDDRLRVVSTTPEIRADLGFKSRGDWERNTRPVKDLRNTLAHGGTVLDVDSDPLGAIAAVQAVRELSQSVYTAVGRR